MTFKHEFARSGLSHDGAVHKPDDATVRPAVNDREFAKILIKRYDDTAFLRGPGEYRSITWIRRPISDPGHIMAGRAERFCRLSRQTRVEKQLHDAEVTGNGSHRSWPTIRRANTRHARTSSGSSHG